MRSVPASLMPSATTAPSTFQSIEFGGGGDCLLRSIAGARARVALIGGAPARRVLQCAPSAVFMEGQAAVMQVVTFSHARWL